MKLVKTKYLTIALLVVLTGCLLVILTSANRSIPVLSFEDSLGETFPNLTMYDLKGQKANPVYSDTENYKLVFSMSSHCDGCFWFINVINTLYTLLSDELKYIVLWKGSIPTDRISDNDLVREASYSVNDRLTGVYPSVVLLDRNNTIVGLTNGPQGSSSVVDTMFDIFGKPEPTSIRNIVKSDKLKTVLFFSSAYSDRSVEEREKIDQYFKSINNETDIYVFELGQQNIVKQDYLFDWGGLFAKLFQVDFYPKYVTITSDDIWTKSRRWEEIIN